MKTTDSKCNFLARLLILLFLLFPLCIACNQKSEEKKLLEESTSVDPIEGVWKLTNQFWVKDGDTLLLGPEEIPIKRKIYLDGYVIWTSEISYDSSEWHAFGTYSFSSHTLKEKFASMSLALKEEMGSEDEMIYQIELDDTYCKQSTNSVLRGTIYLSVEEWKKIN